METCKNGVEWLVHKGDDHTYVCDAHLIPAINKYNPDVKVSGVIGFTHCYWKDSNESDEYWTRENLDTLARRVSALEHKIRNCK